MASQKTIRAVTRWYEWNKDGIHASYMSPPGVEQGTGGMDFDGGTITEARSATHLADFIRTQDGDRPALIRLTLPNWLTASRHRMLQRLLEGLGAQVVAIPRNVLGAADINSPSIEVIDSERRPRPFRARGQLIRAKVVAGWTGRTVRTSYFLSGFDVNERGLSYFFCELPAGVEPTTLAEAYQALRPQSVKLADEKGMRVLRQGDMFFLPMKRIDGLERPTHEGKGPFWHYLHGTNHAVKEIAHKDGLTFARGMVHHRPSGRRRDHHPLRLGGRWHLVVKNTVPVVGHEEVPLNRMPRFSFDW